MLLCADVLIESLPASVGREVFTYAVPPHLLQSLRPGTEVAVPFGAQTRMGYVLDLREQEPPPSIRAILDVTGQQRLDSAYLAWLKQVSDYYLVSLSTVVSAAIPRRLSSRMRSVVRPLPDAVRFLESVERTFGSRSEMYRLGAFLVSSAPHWKTRESCQRQLGRRTREQLKLLSQQHLVEIYTEIQHSPEARQQLAVSLCEIPPKLSARQRELLEHLRAAGGQELVSLFCQRHSTTLETLRRLEGLGAVSIAPLRVRRRPLDEQVESRPLQTLTPDQSQVFAHLREELQRPSGRPVLLHGVTGSGKTEVYLHCLAEVLEKGGGGIFLVPEISLTPQMLRRCRAVFGEHVAVLHSALSEGELLDEWERIREGQARIVVGARSAIFAPVPELRLIVVDEEHESSYKQDNNPRYDARTLARLRMQTTGGLVIFGSATPRIESFASCESGAWLRLSLPRRVHAQPLPPVHIVDMRLEQARGNAGAYSQALRQMLAQTLLRQEQAILLLNRRGYASSWLCRDCGEAVRCPLCSVTLTYHQREQRLKCHYCEHHCPAPPRCPTCNSDRIQGFGLGTQRLEEITQKLFPQARLLRLDRDTTTTKHAHIEILDAFGRGEADILIGTQMVAKGLDFPRVTLVGILAADMALNLPDFRAGERTFQLLTQAAGRAGRSDLPGQIVIQTYAPEHPALHYAIEHDYLGFYAQERHERRELNFPPDCELVRILLADPDPERADQVSWRLRRSLVKLQDPDLVIFGPGPAPLEKLQSLYRFHLLLKHPDLTRLRPRLVPILRACNREIQRLVVDIDPYSML
ncbi:MAG: primosomal protein N' [Candidatus Sericytochromatia bacterium]